MTNSEIIALKSKGPHTMTRHPERSTGTIERLAQSADWEKLIHNLAGYSGREIRKALREMQDK